MEGAAFPYRAFTPFLSVSQPLGPTMDTKNRVVAVMEVTGYVPSKALLIGKFVVESVYHRKFPDVDPNAVKVAVPPDAQTNPDVETVGGLAVFGMFRKEVSLVPFSFLATTRSCPPMFPVYLI